MSRIPCAGGDMYRHRLRDSRRLGQLASRTVRGAVSSSFLWFQGCLLWHWPVQGDRLRCARRAVLLIPPCAAVAVVWP